MDGRLNATEERIKCLLWAYETEDIEIPINNLMMIEQIDSIDFAILLDQIIAECML